MIQMNEGVWVKCRHAEKLIGQKDGLHVNCVCRLPDCVFWQAYFSIQCWLVRLTERGHGVVVGGGGDDHRHKHRRS